MDPSVIVSMREYSKNTSKLKKTAMNILVKWINEKEIEHLKHQFELMDIDHTGWIDAEELYKAILKANLKIPKEDVEQIINDV